ncbi:hypothetical protein [Oceanobacillus oncorhynchi]|uniref:hypothetical protein n=1 Tax=Oceanobacillus oncorhynchi TaxID=545501 RepID=UPI0034D3B7C8
MKKYSFYKSKRGSNYDNEVKKYFQQEEKWRTVIIGKVAELLGENITSINLDPERESEESNPQKSIQYG